MTMTTERKEGHMEAFLTCPCSLIEEGAGRVSLSVVTVRNPECLTRHAKQTHRLIKSKEPPGDLKDTLGRKWIPHTTLNKMNPWLTMRSVAGISTLTLS